MSRKLGFGITILVVLSGVFILEEETAFASSIYDGSALMSGIGNLLGTRTALRAKVATTKSISPDGNVIIEDTPPLNTKDEPRAFNWVPFAVSGIAVLLFVGAGTIIWKMMSRKK